MEEVTSDKENWQIMDLWVILRTTGSTSSSFQAALCWESALCSSHSLTHLWKPSVKICHHRDICSFLRIISSFRENDGGHVITEGNVTNSELGIDAEQLKSSASQTSKTEPIPLFSFQREAQCVLIKAFAVTDDKAGNTNTIQCDTGSGEASCHWWLSCELSVSQKSLVKFLPGTVVQLL